MVSPNGGLRINLIYLVFFLTGISGLIYETVWLRMLIRVFGCTVYATATVLSAFMAGLGIGSYVSGRYIDRAKKPLLVYALIEGAVGIAGLAVTAVFYIFPGLYAVIDVAAHPSLFVFARTGLVFLALIVPAGLMGGTLPVLSKALIQVRADLVNRLGFLYGINTLGAMVGVMVCGFVLLGAVGERATILIGVILNLVAALMALALYRAGAITQAELSPARTKEDPAGKRDDETGLSPALRRWVLWAYVLSGFTALCYEVVWTRILQIYLGTAVYAFSTMLATYLAGIVLGSLWGRWLARHSKDPLFLFAVLELFIGIYGVAGMWLLVQINPAVLEAACGPWYRAIIALVVILPITICFGVLFPVAARCYIGSIHKVGIDVGRLYAANTIGAILGSAAGGFLLIPSLGSMGTIYVLVTISVLVAAGIFLTDRNRLKRPPQVLTLAAGVIMIFWMGIQFGDPLLSLIQKKIIKTFGQQVVGVNQIFVHKENRAGTVTVFGYPPAPLARHLWINGEGMSSLCAETKIMAHLPILLCQNPRDVLVICFGMGTTARSCTRYDELSVDAVEVMPDVFESFGSFHADAASVLSLPRFHRYVQDGRNYLLSRHKQYDVITIDPAPPLESAGTVNLYSREFFALCKGRLKPGGLVCLWVAPAYASEVRMIMRTFTEVFPQATLWRGIKYPGVYLIGPADNLVIEAARFDKAGENKAIVADLNEWGVGVKTPRELLALLLLDQQQFREYVRGQPVITDDHPYTEFPLWRRLRQDDNAILDARQVDEWKRSRYAITH
jgi:spermidine synthase